MVNSFSFIGIIRQQVVFFIYIYIYTLQYQYNVNTTVLKFTVSAQSKTQCYKASGYLSIICMRKMKLGNTPQEQTPCNPWQ